MILDAWQTIWACVILSVLILVLDSFLASRTGPSKTDLVRQKKRDKRTVGLAKGASNE